MDLQQQQLQQLSDWLTQTEERIRKIETESAAGDPEVYKERIEQHKVSSPSISTGTLCSDGSRNQGVCVHRDVFIWFSAQELQNDLETEQVKVNSLTHMVVVVDENSGESATAALEEQLQVCFLPGNWGLRVFFFSHLTDVIILHSSLPFANIDNSRKWMFAAIVKARPCLTVSVWVSAGRPCAAGQRRGGTSCRRCSWCGSSSCPIR